MVEHRWLRAIGPGVIALGAVVAIGSSTQAARDAHGRRSPAPGGADARVAAARETRVVTLADIGAGAWMRFDPTLDADGALVGQRLSIGHPRTRIRASHGPARRVVRGGAVRRLLLVGADDGAASRLFTIDVAAAAPRRSPTMADVIRRATISPAGDDRLREPRRPRDPGRSRRLATAARRHRTGGARAGRRSRPDGRFGRTWSTEFTWSLEGDRAGRPVVRRDGMPDTRPRARDGGRAGPARRRPSARAARRHGRPRLVSYAACRGLPCPLLSVDADSGGQVPLTDAAGLATLSGTGPDARVVHEWTAPFGRRLRSVSPDGRVTADLGAIPTGLRLTPDAVRSGSGTRLPPDWVLLSPDGRLPIDRPADAPGRPSATSLTAVPSRSTR